MAVEIIQDFAYGGFLLLIGYFLRSKIKLLQKLYIPASVIGGVVGLLLGNQVLGKFTPISFTFSANMAALAMPLLAIVFCTQLIDAKFDKRMIKSGLSVAFLNSGTACLQNALCGVIMLILIAVGVSKAPIGMSTMPFTGFYGGHGVPAIAANIFEGLGHWDASSATSVGTTFATVGLLFGVVIGIVVINIAARKGIIAANAGIQNLSEEERSGYIPPEKRTSGAVDAITTNDAINPVAFQLAIIFSIMFFAYKLLKVPFFSSFGITICCLFVSIVYTVLGKFTPVGKYFDRKSLLNTSGAALEFLIVSSVAMTNLSVFADYGLELVLLSVVTALTTMVYVFFFGKRWHKKNWVENSLGTFGLANGVLATGFLLIRVADPDGKTDATLNLALGNSLSTTTVQMFFLLVYPTMLVKNPNGAIGLAVAGLLIFTIAGCILNRKKKTA